MAASTIVDTLSTKVELVDTLPTRETHVRPLLRLEKEEDRIDVWQRVVTSKNGGRVIAKDVEAEVERKLRELAKAYITLTEWHELSTEGQQRAVTRQGNKTFNQTNENIEWAAWSWNPVTGCKHNCEYCYAYDIAKRFYPHGFEPTFHPDRLTAPQNTKVGQPRWKDDIGYKGVFVCSMADLFGEWVPQEWIDAVLASTRRSPDLTFIFLTKNPNRLVGIDWPDNAWVGTSVDRQHRVQSAEQAFTQFDAPVKFLSCEPMLEELTFTNLGMFDWVIAGACSKTARHPEVQPEWRWVESLLRQTRNAGQAFYMKPNIKARPREYPS